MTDYFGKCLLKVLETVAIESVEATPVDGKPFGEEVDKALCHVLSTAKELGFETKNLDGYCGVADIGSGEPFGILGHIDVVPLGDNWSYPQGSLVLNDKVIDVSCVNNSDFAEYYKNAVIFGRGILDDKGPVYLCLYALKKLIDEGKKLKYKVRFIFGANEESGWGCIDHYNKVEKMPDKGFSPDADFPVIYAEKGIVNYLVKIPLTNTSIKDLNGGLRTNMVPDKAYFVIDANKQNTRIIKDLNDEFIMTTDGETVMVKANGVSAHGSLPGEGVNAISKLLKILAPIDDAIQSLLPLTDITGKESGVDISDDASGKLSLNLGTIEVVDGVINATVDIRYPVTYQEDYVTEKIKSSLPNASVEVIHRHAPLYVEKDNEIVKTLLSAYNKVTGSDAEPISIGGGTYARALKEGVAFGPMLPEQESTIHQPNERASVGDLKRAFDIYYEAMKDLLFE